MRKRWSIIFILVANFIVSPVLGAGLKIGAFKINPKITFQSKYHDNIYLDSSNEDSDFIHNLEPEITAGYDGKAGNYIKAGYKAAVVMYSNDSKNNYETHLPFIKFGYKSPRGFYLQAEDKFKHTKDPYSSDENYKLGKQVERWNNSVDLVIGYEFIKKYKLEMLHHNLLTRYYDDDDKWKDSTKKMYGLSCIYSLPGGKTSLFAEYCKTYVTLDEQNDRIDNWNKTISQDHQLHSYSMGMRFTPGGKISGEIKLGIEEQNFKNHYDKNNVAYEDNQGWSASTNLSYNFTSKTIFGMNLTRGYETSSDRQSNSYSNTSFGFNLRQKFSVPLSLISGLKWAHMNYQEYDSLPNKYFNTYTFNFGFEYQPKKWLMGGIEYEHEIKDASRSYYQNDEYSVNTFLVKLTITF